METSAAGDIHSYIITPSGVYGRGSGPVKNTTSKIMSIACLMYEKAGKAFVIGEGTNRLGLIHISDLVSLYLLVVNHALSFYPNAPPSSPYERYYIASTQHVTQRYFAELYAKALHARGIIPSAELGTASYEEAGPFALVFAPNSMTKEERGASLGWKPVGPSIEDTFESDLDTVYPRKK